MKQPQKWDERFVEVINGLGINKPISTKLFNFMHYEIAMASKTAKASQKQETLEVIKNLEVPIMKTGFQWKNGYNAALYEVEEKIKEI